VVTRNVRDQGITHSSDRFIFNAGISRYKTLHTAHMLGNGEIASQRFV